ncbi:Gfo/Idh/MocA family protein [Pedobacter gandavensis]|uniref:Gfo/Idh/MocA family oxidoreductase n=1 Tax=Pedobacter gandavensis TaxID=2679963 RepID=A0ABR6ERJ8_9SPHI|nr:Gfo/Idh/MocA family oxidoreductase [Pedobacter gandavensis]MBB2147672.1 gfo/Idh/MocA family oxidoreductase [Pedobacter gandavensis]
MKSINWGMIGCGDVTEVKSGPAFNKVPNSSLVAVMRRDAEKAEDYAKRHGVPKWYDDAQQLIDDPEVNAIYIATPPAQHEVYALMAFAAGKPVYVEKPMTLNAASAIRMKDAALNTGVKLSIAHYRRAQPMFLKIKSLLEDEEIGAIRLVQLKMLQPEDSNQIANSATNWRLDPAISGGGLFHDLAPHQLDLLVFFFGEWIYASGLSTNQSGTGLVDDLVTGQVWFKSGTIFNGTWCFTVSEQDKTDLCEIIGTTGKISFPVFGHQMTLTKGGVAKVYDFSPLAHVQQPMIEKVTAYFLGQTENPCSADEAILSMQLMDRFTAKS